MMNEIIAGYRNGYYKEEEEREIAEAIAASEADILFVAMSSPKKEYFLHRHKDILNRISFIMGVGGSFDVVSGKVKRAPMWMQKMGLEGLARFIQEPKKMWKRFVLDNYRFIRLVYKWKGRKDAIVH
jgi:N-acetylglucosaminyldiphosphoundecaprenol N-acetyl-beta-D-mannosaminyltransferase